MKEKRIKAVDYLKCLACFFILNSHIASLYPDRIKSLAFGGFLGNCLFFCVSGFCLMNIKEYFPRWYWKRFIRVIIPYLLFIPFLFFEGRLYNTSVVNVIMPFKSYHFIPTILFLYIAFYLAIFLDQHKIKLIYIVLILCAISFFYFYLIYDYERNDIYKHFSFLEMNSYFITMLIGAIIRKSKNNKKWIYFLGAIVLFGLYGYQSMFDLPKELSIFKLAFGIGFSCSLACFAVRNEDKLKDNPIINLVSKVTLEAYIVHYTCVDAYKEISFPTNIVFFYISVIGVAFCLNYVSDKITKIIPK